MTKRDLIKNYNDEILIRFPMRNYPTNKQIYIHVDEI